MKTKLFSMLRQIFVSEKLEKKIYLMFRSLWHRNYRLFFAGQCISLTGTWIQQMAMVWLVYSLTKSPLLMGIITFVNFIPSFFVSPFAGVWIDRVNQYRLLILTQTLFMIQSFILAALALTGHVRVWHIIILGTLVGITNAIDMPLRQAFVVKLIEKSEDLGNAISLNSSSFNFARLVGPAIAGMLIASVGEGICFLINAISYIAVIIALFAMKINIVPIQKKAANVIEQIKEGIKYSFESDQIRIILVYLAIASAVGMSFPVLMPIFAKEILHGGAQTLGFLMSSSGVGSLFGALYLATKKSILDLEIWVFIASLLFGFGLLALAFEHKLLLSLIILFMVGFGMVVIISACNTLVQHFVDDDKRGRVMSLYTMAFLGTAPIGSLLGGAIAEKIGVPDTFFLCGLAIILSALVFRTKLKYFKF